MSIGLMSITTIYLKGQRTHDAWEEVSSVPITDDYYQPEAPFRDVTVTHDGDLWAITNQYVYKSSGISKKVLLYSPDGGSSWQDMTESVRQLSLEGGLIEGQLSDTIIQIENPVASFDKIFSHKEKLFIRVDTRRSGKFIIESSDNGRTWKILTDLVDEDLYIKCGKVYFTWGGNGYRNNTLRSDRYMTRTSQWDEVAKTWITTEESQDTIVKEGTDGLIYYERGAGNTLNEKYRTYSKFGSLDIFVSSNQGSSWKEFPYSLSSQYDENRTLRYYNACHENDINSVDIKLNPGAYDIFDQSIWEKVEEFADLSYPLGDKIDTSGRLYVASKGKIVRTRLSISCGCGAGSSAQEDLTTYGTTIITHGISLGPRDPIYLQWTEKMAIEIVRKAGRGKIYRYDPESGDLRLFADISNGKPIGDREDIVVFDWSQESLLDGKGITAAAAEALYLSLALQNKGKIGLENMHFIGHGRGCAVNSLVVEKFVQRYPENKFSIDQVTNLGPIGLKGDQVTHSKLEREQFPNTLNSVIPWNHSPNGRSLGIFYDSYWQTNGKQFSQETSRVFVNAVLDMLIASLNDIMIGTVSDADLPSLILLKDKLIKTQLRVDDATSESDLFDILNGLSDLVELVPVRHAKAFAYALKISAHAALFFEKYYNSNFDSPEIPGTSSFEWKSYRSKPVLHNALQDTNFISIPDAYIKSIQESRTGYRSVDSKDLRGGYCLSRLNGGRNQRKPDLSGRRIRADYELFHNGSFDMVHRAMAITPESVPYWQHHGGSWTANSDNYMADEGPFWGLSARGGDLRIRHDRFNLSRLARSISLSYRLSGQQSSGPPVELEAVISVATTGESKNHRVKFELSRGGTQQISIPLPISYRGKVVTIEIGVNGLKEKSIIEIDDIKISFN